MMGQEMRARVGRLLELARGFAAEVKRWQDSAGPLLPVEKQEYLRGLYDALAGADETRVVLEKAVKRLVQTFGEEGPVV
jgi:hypothetical protein